MIKKLKAHYERKALERQMKYQLLSRLYLLVEELSAAMELNKEKSNENESDKAAGNQ